MGSDKQIKQSTIKERNYKGELEKTLRAYRIFRIECNRLYRLYSNSIYSYQISREEIYNKINLGKLKHDDEITATSYEGNSLNIKRAAEFAHHMRVQFPRYIRELIFVRLISTLEIFLVDSIRETFYLNRKIFNVGQEEFFKINKAEFLSYQTIEEPLEKFIEEECRMLHSQGYEGLKKFYFKYLKIDFSKSNIDLSKLSKLHDERHLLVHRLGNTDRQYKHKYSTNLKHILIGEEYLFEALKLTGSLSRYINNELVNLIEIKK